MAAIAIIVMILSFIVACEGRIQEPSCSYMENLERLLEKYVRYEHKLAAFSDTLEAWETKVDTKLKDLEKAETERNQQTGDMKANIEEMKQKMKESLETLQRDSGRMESRLETKETEIDQTLTAALQKHEEQLQSLQETYRTPTVLFTSKWLSGTTYKPGDVFKFTTIVSNIGDGYDSSTGYFTAPYTGVYMFTTTICSHYKKSVYAHLIAANATLAGTRKYNGDASETCTSISGVAKLSEGERAWVQCGASGSGTYSNALHGGNTHNWPGFSGMLVHV